MTKYSLLMLGVITLSLTLTQCQKDSEVSSQATGSQLKDDADFAKKIAISSDYIDRVTTFYKTARKEDVQTMKLLIDRINSISAEKFLSSQETRNEYGGAISVYATLLKYKSTQEYLDYLSKRTEIDQLLLERYKGVNDLQTLSKEVAANKINKKNDEANLRQSSPQDQWTCTNTCNANGIACQNQAYANAASVRSNCFATHPVQTTCYTAYQNGHFINYDGYTVFYNATAEVAYYSNTYVSSPVYNSICGTWDPGTPYQVCGNNQDAINSLCQQQYNNTLNSQVYSCNTTLYNCIANCGF